MRAGQILQDVGIIHGGVTVGHLDMPPTFQGREQHEQVRRAIALILIVIPGDFAWLCRYRYASLGDQLLRCLVQADHRAARIVGPLIDLQHIFHAGYERGVGVRRNDPLLPQVGLEDIFLASARSCYR